MTLRLLRSLSSTFGVFLLCCGLVPTGAAQTNVEIELVGPWSYVQDPADAGRVIVIAPQMGHIMAVFKGDNPFDYSNDTEPSAGSHRLHFVTNSCVAAPPSNHYLYPLNGIAAKTVTDALALGSVYSLSLPKPCFYESMLESRFRYNSLRPVTQTDSERSFTTGMILHYNVADPSLPADFDKGAANASKFQFDTNSGSNKRAISVILYVNLGVAPDTRCDSHSAVIFDSILEMWNIPHVFRAFPKLKSLISSNQQLSSYDYTCNQGKADSSNMFANNGSENQRRKATLSHSGKRAALSPGRADCHAAQINVNGVVM
jgi:hypothetical protein